MSVFEQNISQFGIDYSQYYTKDKEWLKQQIWGRVEEASSYDYIKINPVLLFEMIDNMNDYRRGYEDGRKDALNETWDFLEMYNSLIEVMVDEIEDLNEIVDYLSDYGEEDR